MNTSISVVIICNNEAHIIGRTIASAKRFSNDVVVTDGEKPNSVVVQPVFDDGAGHAYQYDIVPEGDSAPTSNL